MEIDSITNIIPDVVNKHWNYELNKIDPSEVSIFSNVKYHWKNDSGLDFFQTPLDIENKPSQTSIIEKQLYYVFKKIFPQTLSRAKIDNIEIDVFVPNYNFGIEYDGYYFHKDKFQKDLDKVTTLQDKGIFLLRLRDEKLTMCKSSENFLELDNPYDINKTFKDIIKHLLNCKNKDIIKIAKAIQDYGVNNIDMTKVYDTYYVFGGDEEKNSNERIRNFYKIHKEHILEDDVFQKFLKLADSRPTMKIFDGIFDDALIEKFYNHPQNQYRVIDISCTNNIKILENCIKRLIDSSVYHWFENLLEDSINYLTHLDNHIKEKVELLFRMIKYFNEKHPDYYRNWRVETLYQLLQKFSLNWMKLAFLFLVKYIRNYI